MKHNVPQYPAEQDCIIIHKLIHWEHIRFRQMNLCKWLLFELSDMQIRKDYCKLENMLSVKGNITISQKTWHKTTYNTLRNHWHFSSDQ